MQILTEPNIDLSRYNMGSPFLYTRIMHNNFNKDNVSQIQCEAIIEKIARFNTSVGSKVFLYDKNESIQVRLIRPLAGGSHGYVYDVEYTNAEGKVISCVLKIVTYVTSEMDKYAETILDTVYEMIVHIAILEEIEKSEEAKEKQRAQKMARVPDFYGMFQCNNPWVDGETCLCTLTEKLDETVDAVIVNSVTSDATTIHGLPQVSTIIAVILYQLVNLLHFLGKVLKFNHRDLIINNAMVKYFNDDGITLCGYRHFQVYLIDFGFSRIIHPKTKMTFSAQTSFFCQKRESTVDYFNESHDVIFFIMSVKRKFSCKKLDSCLYLHPLLDETLNKLLEAASIGIESIDYEKNYQSSYYTSSLAGVDASETQKALLSSKNIKKILTALVRVFAIECNIIRPSLNAQNDFSKHYLDAQKVLNDLSTAPPPPTEEKYFQALQMLRTVINKLSQVDQDENVVSILTEREHNV